MPLPGRNAAVRAAKAVRLAARRPTSHRRPLPDFLVIGAQKAGTTTLFANLAAHPLVRPPAWKEVHFFDTSRFRDVDWYRSHFPTEAQRRSDGQPTLTGEASPFYLVHPEAPQRARAVIPDARLLAILRNPVDRAASGYYHAVRRDGEDRPIEVALDPDAADEYPADADARDFDDPESPIRRRGYLLRGRYAEQLSRWLAAFPREQLLVVATSGLRDGTTMAAAFEFLGLDAASPPTVPDRNVWPHPPLSDALRNTLEAYYAPFNEQLWDLLGSRWEWTP